MKRFWNKALAYILVFAMCFSVVNVPVYARESNITEDSTGAETVSETVTEEMTTEESVSDNNTEAKGADAIFGFDLRYASLYNGVIVVVT